MGCTSSKKRRIRSMSTFMLNQINELKILPSTFIKINDQPFTKVYQSGRTLGKGAFGEVRFCIHKKTAHRRAVKIFKKSKFSENNSLQKLFEEIEILKLLDHPNIIRAYEFFEDSEDFYIVMEHCKGGELFDAIVRRKCFKEHEAALIMRQLFSCLAYLHSKKIAHRDLKPENILLDDKSDCWGIKLIDFGAATHYENGQFLHGSLGTPYYIAPEVLADCYTEKCDLWSAGVIMYILLTGKPPFDGTTEVEILNHIKEEKYNSESTTSFKALSREAKDLIKHLLVPEKERISASDALEHDWIKNNFQEPPTSDEVIKASLSNLLGFKNENKIKDAIITFIVTQLASSQDLREAREIFRKLDQNGDGKLSREELENGFENLDGFSPEILDQIMDEVDTDNNGYIDYTEFLKAATDIRKFTSVANLQNAFDAFDKDGSGKISAEELKYVLKDENSEDIEMWNELIKQVDQNGDGEIDLKEFSDLLSKHF
ncbi:unnamed protein product [Blepharisma stoltei]|uniref:non-specific serine/threonine protein kinase n=1 Tax=Blepharisma stoltei TaxID=1481888 RepID=A0AAU9J9E8_9CILI|nr:unnamed protein product [Blepharisma stoltei]